MITDARSITAGATIEADVCVVGAGPAGISLALELIHDNLRVIILERGGREAGGLSRPGDGVNLGMAYDLAKSRRGGIGGTARAWDVRLAEASNGAQMVPLDPTDFEPCEWMPNSGWPIDIDHLSGCYKRACERAGVNEACFESNMDLDERRESDLGLDEGRIGPSLSWYSVGDRFTDDLVQMIERSDVVDIVFHATAAQLETVPNGDHVTEVRVGHAGGEPRFSVRAKYFVLAAGGIENPRLLLASNSVLPGGIGNRHDLVGRFFMEHPKGEVGILLPSPGIQAELGKYAVHEIHGSPVRRHLKLRASVLSSEKLQACRFGLWPASPDWLHDDLREIALRCRDGGTMGDRPIYAVSYSLEQAPDPSNRVTLSDGSDGRGRLPELRWHLGPSDYRSLIRCAQVLQEEFHLAGAGVVFLKPHHDETGGYEIQKWRGVDSPIIGSHHHIGTTRMADEETLGVVDASCRVHGVDNLFVAGSSVFPTSSHANPTLTIIALALRLGDHLRDLAARAN